MVAKSHENGHRSGRSVRCSRTRRGYRKANRTSLVERVQCRPTGRFESGLASSKLSLSHSSKTQESRVWGVEREDGSVG